jgi:hypothetical protein
VADLGIRQQFLHLPILDQVAYFVFVSRETYDKAVKLGLIPSEYV